jgi:hypothetical protein
MTATAGLDAAHALAVSFRDSPGLTFIAVNTGGVTIEQHLLGLIAEQDAALYETREALRKATWNSSRDEVLEDAALALENARQAGGAYGQQERRPSNYASAARHVRTLKTGTE